MIDPVIAVGHIVAGLTARSWWMAAGAAALWTAFVDTLVATVFRSSEAAGLRVGPTLLAAMAAALLAVAILGVRRAWHRAHASVDVP
jgi:hypothetical protein